uniref:Uncharacterized protein n=1 Tax=Amphimedon queenslandica TaxID=400682 RepID=A0A1X7SUR5_AMPQE
MYTNIDNTTGLTAVRKAFNRNPDPNRPDDAILQLLEICLSRNDFTFNGKTYLQTSGTAMGKRFAPSSDIKLKKDKPVSNHFNLDDHSIDDLTLIPIERIEIDLPEDETTKFRQSREAHWIETLNTARPIGLNIHHNVGIAPFVVPFNTTSNRASKIVHAHYKSLQEKFPHVYKQKMIVAYSKNKNLNDNIVHSKLKTIST